MPQQHEAVSFTPRPRWNALSAVLAAAALALPLCVAPAMAETPHHTTVRRRSADCQLLLTEKGLLGYDVSRPEAEIQKARKIGLAGDLAGALRILDDTGEELRRLAVPWSGPPAVTMITGAPLVPGAASSGTSLTSGGLGLQFDSSGRMSGVTLDGRDIASGVAGGFYVVDAATGEKGLCTGRFTGTGDGSLFAGTIDGLQAGIEARFVNRGDCLEVQGTLRDTSGSDRALVLCFKIPLQGSGFTWWDDADLAIDIPSAACVLQNSAPAFSGKSGQRLISTYPLACVSDQRAGLVLGTAIHHPAVFRLVYDGRDKSLNLYYEFGLSRATAAFPGEARFRFVIYALEEPVWGFRSALQTYYRIYPEAFAGRAENAGLWGTVEAAAALGEEYKRMGFAFLQGENQNPRWGNKLGLWSIRYCQPWSFLVPGATAPAKGQLKRLADDPATLNLKTSHRLVFGPATAGELIRAVEVSVIHDRDGEPVGEPDQVYHGVKYVLNPDPDIVGERGERGSATLVMTDVIMPTVRTHYKANGQTRWGLFFDVAGSLLKHENYRREHMAVADFPLTFDEAMKQPVILGLSSACEFLAHVRAFTDREGGMVAVNTSPQPYNMIFLAPFCDMAGTEHLPGRREMNNRRALAAKRPIGFRTAESWEELLKHGLFYGVFPSRVPPGKVRTNIDHLEQAKPLLTRVVPLIKTVASAGWEPVTRARSGDPGLLVERFGSPERGPVYFTVWNRTSEERDVVLGLDETAGRWCGDGAAASELAGQRKLDIAAGTISLRLPADEVAVIRLEAGTGQKKPGK
jgi:hypothetical protein